MALTDESGGNGMVMPVAPMGNYGNMGGCNWGSDGLFWIIILFLFAAMGGWGNGFGNGAGNAMPYVLNNDVQRGFDQSAVISGINGINSMLANAEVSRCNAQTNLLQTLNSNQNATLAAMNGLAFGIQQNGYENRAATADLKYTVATENCADRTQSMLNTRDIVDSQTRGTQAILDKLCQLELDGVKAQVESKNDRISELQTQLNMANLAASQTAQNALITQGFSNEVDALYNRLNSCPVPSIPVYGRTPIFQCNNGGSGCGCGGSVL